MGKDIYEAIKPEGKQKKVKKPVNKDSLIIGIVVAVVLLLTAGIVFYYFFGVNNQILVKYKGGEITRGEYEAMYRSLAPTLNYYYGMEGDNLSDAVVDQILLSEVIYNEAISKEYKLTEEEKKTVDDMFSNEESVMALRSQGINPEIYRQYYYQDSIITRYLKDIEEATTTEQLKQSIIANEGEDADFNLYKTRHILIEVLSNATEEEKQNAKKEAEDLFARVKKGEDISKLAEEFSDDKGTSGEIFEMINGKSMSTLDEEYKKAVIALESENEVCFVESKTYGYFIIKLEEVEEEGRLTSDTELSYYVNSDYVSSKAEEAFDTSTDANKKQLEKARTVGNKLAAELGLISTSSEK